MLGDPRGQGNHISGGEDFDQGAFVMQLPCNDPAPPVRPSAEYVMRLRGASPSPRRRCPVIRHSPVLSPAVLPVVPLGLALLSPSAV